MQGEHDEKLAPSSNVSINQEGELSRHQLELYFHVNLRSSSSKQFNQLESTQT
jgi:hypothetical protein